MPPDLDCMREMTVFEVRTKASAMNKMFRGQALYFIQRKQLQEVFALHDEQVFTCLNLMSVNKNVIRVGSVDFWGAVALAASGSSEEKIAFCFRLMDTNRDDHLSMNELVILLICITRGLSRLKGFELIPEELIDRIVSAAFHSERKKLRSDGELSSASFTSFALANENCRSYLAAIGAKVPPVDAAALVIKRSQALKELAQVRFRIEETIHKMEEAHTQQAVQGSRGGDLPFLRLTDADSVISSTQRTKHSKQSAPASVATLSTYPHQLQSPVRVQHVAEQLDSPDMSTIVSVTETLQDQQSQHTGMGSFAGSTEEELIMTVGRDHPVRRFIMEEDSWKNEIYRVQSAGMIAHVQDAAADLCKRICSKQFEGDLLRQWLKLPHDEDRLAQLDEVTLIALLSQVGIHLPYSMAQECLQTVSCSQLKKYSFHEVLAWFRHNFDLTDHPNRVRNNAWFQLGNTTNSMLKKMHRSYNCLVDTISHQRKILTGLVRVEEINIAKKLAEYRALTSRNPSLLQWQYTINAAALRAMKSQKKNDSGNDDEDSSIMKWNTRMRLSVSTVPFTNLSTKRSRDSTRIKTITHDDGFTEMNIDDLDNLQATDLLDYFNVLHEKEYFEQRAKQAPADPDSDQEAIKRALGKEDKGPIAFASVAWFVVELQPLIHDSQVYVVQRALQNALEATPVDLREKNFTSYYVEVFSTEKAEVQTKKDKTKRKASIGSAVNTLLLEQVRHSKLILVALLHTEDHFLNEEKKFVLADVFASRAIVNANFELNLMNTWKEIYLQSMEYVHYESKLFGPQEEELGEDHVNPLRFAKEVRSRKKELQRILDRMGSSSREELGQYCKEHGAKDTGTKREVMDRLAGILERKKELIGHGELSQFAKNILGKTFSSVRQEFVYDAEAGKSPLKRANSPSKNTRDQGLSLWEFNRLLHKSNAKTFYDKSTYKDFLDEHQLLVNRDGQMVLSGLCAYYEKVGQLADDNKLWGVGSLDDIVAGQFNMQVQFEPAAWQSLMSLLDKKPLFVPNLFKLFAYLGTIKEHKVEGEVNKLSDILQQFPLEFLNLGAWKESLQSMLREPGFLAVWLNELVSWCNAQTHGPLVNLRRYVGEIFSHLPSNTNERPSDDEASSRPGTGGSQTGHGSASNTGSEADADDPSLFNFENVFGDSFVQSVQAFLQRAIEDVVSKPGTVTVSDAADADGAEDDGHAGISASIFKEAAMNALPQYDDHCMGNNNLMNIKREIMDDLLFLNNIRTIEGLTISLEESIAIDNKKEHLEAVLEKVVAMQDRVDSLLPVHLLAAYDALRLFGKGVGNAGMGTKDLNIRSTLVGVDIFQHLPRGMGEANHIEQLLVEKQRRFDLRRQAAMAAVERERLRRAMTEEDLERIRLENLRIERLQAEVQDKALFVEAKARLYESREVKKTMGELGQIVKIFEDLAKRKNGRFPEGFDAIVATNNLACVLVEVYGTDHPLCERKYRAFLHILC